jgi:hypothetical protein
MLGTPWMFMSYGNLFFTPHHPTHCEFEHVMVLTTWAQGLGQQWLRLALQRPLPRQCQMATAIQSHVLPDLAHSVSLSPLPCVVAQ